MVITSCGLLVPCYGNVLDNALGGLNTRAIRGPNLFVIPTPAIGRPPYAQRFTYYASLYSAVVCIWTSVTRWDRSPGLTPCVLPPNESEEKVSQKLPSLE